MTKPKFHFEVSFNEAGEPVAGYLRVREGKVAQTKEVSAGLVFADYAADGSLLGVELLGPCDARVLDPLVTRTRSRPPLSPRRRAPTAGARSSQSFPLAITTFRNVCVKER